MKLNYGIAMAIIMGIAVAGLTACEKGPAESAGASIDKAVDDAGDKLEDAGDKVKDAVN